MLRRVDTKPDVITVVDPPIRRLLESACGSSLNYVHVERTVDGAAAAHERMALAVLVSPSVLQRESADAVRRLVATIPGVAVVAVVGDEWKGAPESLLCFGASGVRHVASLTTREGWQHLRQLIDNGRHEHTGRILAHVLWPLSATREETSHFFGALVRLAPTTTTVRALCQQLSVNASSLMSRFYRARLPAPKMYLAMTRLTYAAAYFGSKYVSLAAVADRLGYSSPQSFGRHVRSILGVTAGEFRRQFSLEAALDHYVQRLIIPYEVTLRTFDPVGPGPIIPHRIHRPLENPVRLVAER